MANVYEFDDVAKAAWEEWVASRPPRIQEMALRWPPNKLYRMASTNHRVTLVSYAENGTVSVAVSGQFNFVTFGRNVFGVDPETLTECDLPAADEPVGDMAAMAGYTEDDIKNILIPQMRAAREGK